ncbi:MAG: GspH/FimT family pseudopilin, partial [Limnohabitans sp.]
LMVVLLIIGFATAGVALALRDSSQTQLEREAQRLVAKLEAARAQSRTSGQTMVWVPTAQGYVIETLPRTANQTVSKEVWLQANTQASIDVPANASGTGVVLGPEPILSPIQISLRISGDMANANTNNNATQPNTLRIGTQGLKPFEVLP